MIKTPIVSVCMITYGHEEFITQAITGILDQETTFAYELIIANDCSPDNTGAIVKNIIDTHENGHLIDYYSHKENRGMMSNFAFALQQCKGKYIALCEGDDYWTDTLKLKKQVNFLETHPETNMCFHRAQVLKKRELYVHPVPEPFQVKGFQYIELLKTYNFITTASVVFKKPDDLSFPKWFYKVPFGDLSLYKLIAKNTDIMCLNEVMSVYRKHEDGAYSGLSSLRVKQDFIKFYKIINPFLNKEEQDITRVKIKTTQDRISKLRFPKKPFLQKVHIVYLRYLQFVN